MKRLFFISIVLCAVSCAYHEKIIVNQFDSYSSNVTDYTVGYNAIKHLFSRTKGSSIEIIPYEKNADTLFYVVNTNEGWQIISNDQRATPILASGNNERLDPFSKTHNGIRVWLEAASNYIVNIKNSPLKEDQLNNVKFWQSLHILPHRDSIDNGNYRWMLVESTQLTGTYITDNVPHLISTKWGQGYPWNNELPYDEGTYYDSGYYERCLTGCLAVAIVQILYYWHHTFGFPNYLYHTVNVNGWQQWIYGNQSNISITTSDITNSTRWDYMPLTASGINSDYVGDLMISIGKYVYMLYGSLGSAASINPNVFELYDMQYLNSAYNYSTVNTSLNNEQPVIIFACPYNQITGHYWIIDGKFTRINTYQTSRTWYELEDGNIHGIVPPGTFYYTDEEAHAIDPYVYDGKITYSYSSTTDKFLRMNWGYDGLYDDAEYSINVLWHPDGDNEPTYATNAQIFYGFSLLN